MAKALLLQAFDGLFPSGAFAFSGGLETYVAKGLVTDKASLAAYLSSMLDIAPYGDLGFCAKAAQGGAFAALDDMAGAALAAEELREASRKKASRFMKAWMSLCELPRLQGYQESVLAGLCEGHFCIATGLFIADIQSDTLEGLEMYAYSMLSVAANHAAKLIPLPSLLAQSALAAVCEGIEGAALRALHVSESELGRGLPAFHLRSAQHESLPARLYIS